MSLCLGPHWERQAGSLSPETFYVSCLEFDSQGVLLVAGASNGVIALYDFDDAFHRTLNVGQIRQRKEGDGTDKGEDDDGGGDEEMRTDRILHPVRVTKGAWAGTCVD